MASKKLTDARYYGKACISHPEFAGLRDKGSRACVQCRSESRFIYRQANPQKDKESTQKWMDRNREILNQKQRGRNASNPGRASAYAMERQLAKYKRIPKWADITKIREFYMNKPKGMVVDHVIPLRGKMVSGLHVHNNFQYLTKHENDSKGNKFISDWT